jgi:hypothetical protein
MKIILNICILISVLFLANCASGNYYNTPTGVIFQSVTLNKDISSGTDLGSKSGEACTMNILGLFSIGKAGIVDAAANGGIKVVKAVDYSRTSFLSVVYVSVCTIARGE